MQLAEVYRPSRWSEVIAQPKALKAIGVIRKRAGTLGGQAYFISGPSGTGKTTIGRLIASEVCDPDNIEEFDASKLTADTLDRIERDMHYRGMGAKDGRAWIVNEVHGLRKEQVRRLLELTEPAGGLPPWIVFVFTTTVEGEAKLFDCDDASPFLSRCKEIPMAQRDLAPAFAQRAMEIAQAENLDGRPLKQYLELVRQNRNNLRAVLQHIESGGMLPD